MDVVLLRARGDELAVGAPLQRDVAAAPGEATRRQDDLADAPHGDAVIVGAGDAAAVLAEIEAGHRALMRPELADLAILGHEHRAAHAGGDRAVAMGGKVLDPLSLLHQQLRRRAVERHAQYAAVVAATHEAVAGRIADQAPARRRCAGAA